MAKLRHAAVARNYGLRECLHSLAAGTVFLRQFVADLRGFMLILLHLQ